MATARTNKHAGTQQKSYLGEKFQNKLEKTEKKYTQAACMNSALKKEVSCLKTKIPDRKFKGRVVFLGDQVKNQFGEAAMFQ